MTDQRQQRALTDTSHLLLLVATCVVSLAVGLKVGMLSRMGEEDMARMAELERRQETLDRRARGLEELLQPLLLDRAAAAARRAAQPASLDERVRALEEEARARPR